MSAGSFKQDSLRWRIDLFGQKIDEWLEFKTSELERDFPDFSWLKSELLWQVIKVLLWSIIAVLLVWLTWQLWLFIRPYLKRWQRRDRNLSPNFTIPTPQSSAADWVARSQEARQQGDYRQGIFCLYQGMLQLLDERGIVSQQGSRTDVEYQRSLEQLQLSQPQSYELLLSIHQRLCFSSAEASPALFEQCQQAYRQIEVS